MGWQPIQHMVSMPSRGGKNRFMIIWDFWIVFQATGQIHGFMLTDGVSFAMNCKQFLSFVKEMNSRFTTPS